MSSGFQAALTRPNQPPHLGGFSFGGTPARYKAWQKLRSDALAAQLEAVQAQQALHEAQAQRDAAAIALYQALGGGWGVPPCECEAQPLAE